jgi:putative hydrolase of the HAD superfamily
MITQPDVVVFDLGKVLVDFDYRIAARQLAELSVVPPERIVELLLDTPLLGRYERGEMSTEEFHAVVGQHLRFRGDFAEFARRFGDIFTPIDPMIRLHAEVRAAGFPTAVLSNTNDLAVRQIRAVFPFFAGFDHYVFSHEHHAMKPDIRLYRAMEAATGRRGAALCFIDDRPENVDAAARLGWQSSVHHSPDATRRRLQELRVLA